MKTMRFSVYVGMLLVLVASFISGCGGTSDHVSKGEPMTLTEVLKSDLTNVSGIEIQFDDGNKMSVTDPKIIQDIVSEIKNIKVRETESKSVGFLYFLDLKEGNKTYRLNSNLTFDGKNYEATDDKVKKLNDFILKIGREKIPGLLPGVK